MSASEDRGYGIYLFSLVGSYLGNGSLSPPFTSQLALGSCERKGSLLRFSSSQERQNLTSAFRTSLLTQTDYHVQTGVRTAIASARITG